MGLRDAVRNWFLPETSQRSDLSLSMDEWASYFQFGNTLYPTSLNQTLVQGAQEQIGHDFAGLVQGAYKSNGVVFACMLARQLLFSEARFMFRRINDGRPGELFGGSDGRSPGNRSLGLLANPWPGGTTGDLLTRAIQDADLAGNAFFAKRNNRIRRMRPDWVTIVLGSYDDPSVEAGDIDAETIGIVYHPGGLTSGRPVEFLQAGSYCHFAPVPDPVSHFRGMSWLTPVIREIMGDSAATTHKLKFFENGATPNMVVSLDPNVKSADFPKWVAMMEQNHAGVINAYKTLYLGAGSHAEVVGANMQQLDFKNTQGAGETRIAAAAGVPPVIVGLSEGLQAATYSNYGQARRRFADGTMRPLWRNFAGSMSSIITVPFGAELWYDDRDIPFLAEDKKDAADVQSLQAQSIKALTDAGYESQSVIAAITSGDLTRLTHTGLFSVQLQPPGTTAVPPDASKLLQPILNGKGTP